MPRALLTTVPLGEPEQDAVIEKPSIIVTSLGRTGTKFFSLLLGGILPDCDSFHEPDLMQFFDARSPVQEFLRRVKDAGVYYMVFQKLLGRWTMISLSDKRMRGTLSEDGAAREVLRQRMHFVNSKPGSVYVESNGGYYGLIDVLKHVFAQHRVVYIVRDGRDWVSSTMNVGEVYAPRGLRGVFSHKMPTAMDFPGDPLHDTWRTLSRFEKVCWVWAKLNEYAFGTLSGNPQARMFRFEQIFKGSDKYRHFNELVGFATSLPNIDRSRVGSTDGWLERRVHQSTTQFPAWERWTPVQKAQFANICGPLMDRLGYAYG